MSKDKTRKFSLVGIAAIIGAVVAAPGVLINAYLDWQNHKNNALIQESSYNILSQVIEDIDKEINICHNNTNELKNQLAELRGFVNGINYTATESHSDEPAIMLSDPESTDLIIDEEKYEPIEFNDIRNHVQQTGEIFEFKK